MNQPSGGVSSNNISPGHDDRLHMLNAQQEYHYAQPPLRLMTGNFSVNPYYAADSQYDTDSQSDNYMLSPATPLTPNDAYTAYPLPDSTRNWPSYSNRYVSSYARYSSYDQAPYTTELSTRTRPAMTDGSSGVFSTHGLHMSLPNPVPGGRELPPPTVGARSQIQTQSYEASHLRSEAYSKPYSYWPSGQATAGARNGSIASSRSSELVAPILQKPSTTPTIGSDHSPLTLLPSSTGCPDISPMATTTNAEHTDAETSLSQHRGLGIEHHSLYGIPTASVSETRIEHARPPSNTYTFSIAPRGHQIHNELPSGSEDGQIGTSSATYVPIQYPAEPSDARTYSLGSSRHGSINNRIHALSQRSSVLSMRQDH